VSLVANKEYLEILKQGGEQIIAPAEAKAKELEKR
jgi:hypothetical protein